MPKESLWTFSEQMKEELAGQLSPILDETEAWLSIRAAIRGTAAEPHIRQERSLQVEELPPENVTIEMMEHRLFESGCVCSGSPMEGIGRKVRRT